MIRCTNYLCSYITVEVKMKHMANRLSETHKHSDNGNHAAALEQAAIHMVETLPRMFKTVKQQLRSSDPSCRELGDSQM